MTRDSLLIQEVKKYPILWDQNNADYKNRAGTQKAWAKVAKTLDVTEQEAKTKWKYLRDIFLKQLKKYGIPSEEEHFPGKWRYFKALTFLLPLYNENVPVDVRVSPTTRISDNEDVEPNFVGEDHNLDSDQEQWGENETHDTKNGIVQFISADNMATSVETSSNLKKQMALSKRCDDDDLLFLRSLAPFFKNLSPIRKLVVRNKIQDILVEELRGDKD